MKKNDNDHTGLVVGIIILILAIILVLYFVLKPTPKSNNTNLSSLVVANHPITFAKDVTTYSITVDENTESLEVKAVPESSDSNVIITGNTNIQTGNNEITIMVTAEDKTTKTYTIHVNKENNKNNDMDTENKTDRDNKTDQENNNQINE